MTPRLDEDLPTLLRALAEAAPAPCLLIGGLAFAEYGLPCESYDIVVAVAEPDGALFDRALPLLSYRKIAETHCAARYRHSKSLPDLDLLMFPEVRFQEILGRGWKGQCGLHVPRPEDWQLLPMAKGGIEKQKTASPSKNEVERRLREALDRMHETYDPIQYVIYRQEECPLPAKL